LLRLRLPSPYLEKDLEPDIEKRKPDRDESEFKIHIQIDNQYLKK
jgi:hypothetical protein